MMFDKVTAAVAVSHPSPIAKHDEGLMNGIRISTAPLLQRLSHDLGISFYHH